MKAVAEKINKKTKKEGKAVKDVFDESDDEYSFHNQRQTQQQKNRRQYSAFGDDSSENRRTQSHGGNKQSGSRNSLSHNMNGKGVNGRNSGESIEDREWVTTFFAGRKAQQESNERQNRRQPQGNQWDEDQEDQDQGERRWRDEGFGDEVQYGDEQEGQDWNGGRIRLVDPEITTAVVEKRDRICFSSQPISQCPEGTQPQPKSAGGNKRQQKIKREEVEFVCLPRHSFAAKQMLKEMNRRSNGQVRFNRERMEQERDSITVIAQQIVVPQQCIAV